MVLTKFCFDAFSRARQGFGIRYLELTHSRSRLIRPDFNAAAFLAFPCGEAFIISASPYCVRPVRDIQALHARYPSRCATRT